MSNKVYDVLKKICMCYLPACFTLATTIMGIFGVDPTIISIVDGVGVAVITFLGTILGISTAKYNAAMKREEAKNHEGI